MDELQIAIDQAAVAHRKFEEASAAYTVAQKNHAAAFNEKSKADTKVGQLMEALIEKAKCADSEE